MSKMIKKVVKSLMVVVVFMSVLSSVHIHAAEPKIKIGVLQYVKHEALDATLEGFQETLMNSPIGERIEWNIQNANGDNAMLQSISEKLARESDLLFAIATPAAQALATVEKEKPIFIAAVTDPVAAKLVNSMEKPETNVTGTSDMAPIKEQVALLKKHFPEAKNVGIIYNASESNSQVLAKLATQELESQSLTVHQATVVGTNDISQVLPPLLSKIEVLFLITDNTIDSAIVLVGDLAKEQKIPTVGSSEPVVLKNGLMTLSNSYKDFGVQTAEMVLSHIEEGLPVSEMPIETAKHLEIIVNDVYAETLGLDSEQLRK
ncbi:MAG: ABC transporter substrate-binding protein [Aerococcaceae bacterium]|nr:ABC transporter substrate-binding protein [Aerococcaceae bacterium]